MKRAAEQQITEDNPDGGGGEGDVPGATGPSEDIAGAEPTPQKVQKITNSADFWRCQIEAVYRRRNPHKLPGVDALLEKHRGREAVLYAKVCKTYDLDPTKFYADDKAWASYDTDTQDGEEAGGKVTEVPNLFSTGPPLFGGGGEAGDKRTEVPSLFGTGAPLFAGGEAKAAGATSDPAGGDGKKDGGAVAADCKTQ